MLNYVIRDPRERDQALPILVFLHGKGEAFKGKDAASPSGLRNLFNHAVPRFIEQGEPEMLAELDSFVVIAPQLQTREEDGWLDNADAIDALVSHFDRANVPRYVMGFSKGGFGAFEFAPKLGARAIVTIDASDLSKRQTAITNVQSLRRASIPFWAIYTEHQATDFQSRITDFHREIAKEPGVSQSNGVDKAPAAGSSAVTSVDLPKFAAGLARHVEIASVVSRSRAAFAYLRSHS